MQQSQIKREKNKLCYFFLILTLITALLLFGISMWRLKDDIKIESLISLLLSTTFVIFFIVTGIHAGKKGKVSTILACLLLITLNSFEILLQLEMFSSPTATLKSFTNKSLTEAVKYAEKHDIELKQIYEYSDMIDEYHIIGQNIESGTKLKDVKALTIAVSEGPNPDKEVIIPNMITWNDEAVLKFVKENNLNHVEIEFIESEKVKDTVIEQEGTGNRKRSDLLKLTFSLGQKDEISETKLIDLTKKSEFEAIFWLKQHGIPYELERDFSNKIKRGHVMRQSEKIGTMMKPFDKFVTLTISKGAKIKVPDLTTMTTTEITEWIIKNKLKVEFNDQYDDQIKENKVIKASHKKGDIIEQRTLVSITLSKGKLKMPKTKDLTELKSWAEKYGIAYQEEYEFDSLVEKGDIIKISHKEGDTIKNGETIIVTISQGKKTTVPKLVGMKKQAIITKLKELNLKYNFIYQSSTKIEKDSAISQSMKEGSEVAEGATITITLSSGKKETANNTTSNSSNNKPNNNQNNTNNNEKPTTPSCTEKSYTVSSKIRDIFTSNDGYNAVSNALYSFFSSNYPNVKISVIGVTDSGMSSGSYVSGLKPGSKITSCNTTPYTISIAR